MDKETLIQNLNADLEGELSGSAEPVGEGHQ